MSALFNNAASFISNEINKARTQIEDVLITHKVSLEPAINIGRILWQLEVVLRNNIEYTNNESPGILRRGSNE